MFYKLILPLLLFTSVNAQKVYTYSWERYGLQFNSSVILNEMSEENYWDVDDDSLDLIIEVERIPFKDYSKEALNLPIKNAIHLVADTLGYGKVRDGGIIQGAPEGHYVVLKDDGYRTYFVLIIDRYNRVVYEIYVEDFMERKSKMLEIINSIRFT